MVNRFRRISMIGSLAVVTTITVGCGPTPVHRSDFSVNAGGRQIIASFDGAGGIATWEGEGDGSGAEIHFDAGKLRIEKRCVRLNDVELAELPEETTKVEVDYTATWLTVKADGNMIIYQEVRRERSPN